MSGVPLYGPALGLPTIWQTMSPPCAGPTRFLSREVGLLTNKDSEPGTELLGERELGWIPPCHILDSTSVWVLNTWRYRGSSLLRIRLLLGPYSRTMPRVMQLT